MSDKIYKCANPKAVCNKIWQAAFDFDSFNSIVESKNPEAEVATVSLGDYVGPDQRIGLVATLLDHPWSPAVFECLVATILENEDTLDEWSLAKSRNQWTVTMKWRD